MKLSTEQVARFEQEGYLVVPRLLSPGHVDRLAAAWEEIREQGTKHRGDTDTTRHPVLRNILASGEGSTEPVNGKVSLHIEHAFRYHSEFRDLVYHERLVGIVESVLGNDIRLLDDQFYYKPAQTGGATHWHRDSDYFLTVPVVTIWMPLNDVDEENGCLTMIPGSHKPGFHPPGVVSSADNTRANALGRLHNVDMSRVHCVPVPMKKGDGLLIHRELLHCSLENRSTRERKSYLLEYFAGKDYGRLKRRHPGIFSYHERFRYNYLVRRNPRFNDLLAAAQRVRRVLRLKLFGRSQAGK